MPGKEDEVAKAGKGGGGEAGEGAAKLKSTAGAKDRKSVRGGKKSVGRVKGRGRGRGRGGPDRRQMDGSDPYWEINQKAADLDQDKWPELEVDASTAELEAIVFGKRPEVTVGKDSKDEEAPQAPERPKKKKKRRRAEDSEAEEEAEEDVEEAPAEPKAAWEDADDAGLELNLDIRKLRRLRREQGETISGVEYVNRQREKFVKLHGTTPSWATAAQEGERGETESEDEAPEEVATSRTLVAKRSDGALPPLEVNVKRLKEVYVSPGEKKGPAVIRALQFHPESTLMLTAGLDKTLRLFAVDGDENPKVSSYHFKDFPIMEASFMPGGSKILMTGDCWQMWGLDVATGEPLPIRPILPQYHNRLFGLTPGPDPSVEPGLKSSKMFATLGDNGTVIICDAATCLPIRTLRMSMPGSAAAFAPGRDSLYTADTECNIYEWDLGSGRCRQRIKEPWATGISCLATSPVTPRSARPLLAVGTPSGNIDMFDLSGDKLPREPFKSISNLRTNVTGIRFHSSGELCAGFSQEKKDHMKLIHTATMTVFKNWPHQNAFRRVSSQAFSRSGGLMAVGTDEGRVLLYQLRHFEVSS